MAAAAEYIHAILSRSSISCMDDGGVLVLDDDVVADVVSAFVVLGIIIISSWGDCEGNTSTATLYIAMGV